MVLPLNAAKKVKKTAVEPSDREVWTSIVYKMAEPVLRNMSAGTLQQNMQLELSPVWDGRDKKVAYMECFGRLMAGIAPWLALPDDDTAEGAMRKQLRDWALKSYANAVDPASPDCLLWDKEGQVLVDAAYVAESFLRAYDTLWEPLDDVTKQRYIDNFISLRWINPVYSNWLLFTATIETFLQKAAGCGDTYRLNSTLRKINEWYVGDGWYADGIVFSFDYYNSYVIHPMYVECLDVLTNYGERRDYAGCRYDLAWNRLQRYGAIVERLISPEGTFPVFGRSITYRCAVLQPLAMLALRESLPEGLSEGQVRAAITAVAKRMFSDNRNYNEGGYLTLGFNGSQPDAANGYTNNGSLYIASLAFLPLGLPANHSFWTSPAEKWTSKKAWEGDAFPQDHYYSEDPNSLKHL